jgi:hypothetical protein
MLQRAVSGFRPFLLLLLLLFIVPLQASTQSPPQPHQLCPLASPLFHLTHHRTAWLTPLSLGTAPPPCISTATRGSSHPPLLLPSPSRVGAQVLYKSRQTFQGIPALRNLFPVVPNHCICPLCLNCRPETQSQTCGARACSTTLSSAQTGGTRVQSTPAYRGPTLATSHGTAGRAVAPALTWYASVLAALAACGHAACWKLIAAPATLYRLQRRRCLLIRPSLRFRCLTA